MSDPTLLTGTQESVTPAVTPQEGGAATTPATEDQAATILSSILNEQGETKYKDVTTALEALKHSQSYIAELKNKASELEGKVNQYQSEIGKQEAVTDFVSQLQSSLEKPKESTEQPSEQPTALTMDDFDKLLAQREQTKLAEANIKSVTEKLAASHGDKADEYLKTTASSLNMSIEELTALAAKSPNAALQLLGSGTSVPAPRSLHSSVNSASLPHGSQPDGPPKPTSSMMRGASSRDLNAYMQSLISYHNK